jgi:hypothetical protein
MVLARKLAPTALDLHVAGVMGDVQHLVRVASESCVGHQPATLPQPSNEPGWLPADATEKLN